MAVSGMTNRRQLPQKKRKWMGAAAKERRGWGAENNKLYNYGYERRNGNHKMRRKKVSKETAMVIKRLLLL